MAPNEWSVAELVGRCTTRPPDENAWEEFVRRFHSTIRANVQKTFQRKAREEADRRPQFPEDAVDDLVQSVYERLVENRSRALKRFEGGHDNSIYQYLAMISVNVVRDYFREMKAKKRPKITCSLDELLETSGDGAILGEGAAVRDSLVADPTGVKFAVQEVEIALGKALAGRNRHRDALIFKLHFYEGLTSDEIIEVMGLEISAIGVNSILNRLVRKVRGLVSANQRH